MGKHDVGAASKCVDGVFIKCLACFFVIIAEELAGDKLGIVILGSSCGDLNRVGAVHIGLVKQRTGGKGIVQHVVSAQPGAGG